MNYQSILSMTTEADLLDLHFFLIFPIFPICKETQTDQMQLRARRLSSWLDIVTEHLNCALPSRSICILVLASPSTMRGLEGL